MLLYIPTVEHETKILTTDNTISERWYNSNN